MSVLGTQALTLSDYKKRINPDGTTAFIVEALEKVNPITQDARWKEGNLPTGNVTTIRTACLLRLFVRLTVVLSVARAPPSRYRILALSWRIAPAWILSF